MVYNVSHIYYIGKAIWRPRLKQNYITLYSCIVVLYTKKKRIFYILLVISREIFLLIELSITNIIAGFCSDLKFFFKKYNSYCFKVAKTDEIRLLNLIEIISN